ncbi:recombinase family protein [Candidatus Lokiarchaeum ossiferum]|uniref:recombinase family protein n=1 Tax=Candidatus Lokiarchaeum ossiferum TaxID=2951803 RepID=UPI00352C439D
MKVFAYYRISPTPRKNSPEENQKISVQSYCEDKEIEIVKEFTDLLVSGSEMSRPEFNKMLSELNSVDGIIIFDVSRFGRDAKEAVPLFMNILNMDKKITLVKNSKTLDYSQNSQMSIWELLVPVIEFFQAEEYIKNLHIKQKIGIQRKIKVSGSWGPKKKIVDWKKYDYYIEMGVPKIAIAKMMDISQKTLYRRLAERKK